MRPPDLDRILEIEHASFGRDAYDRKLFADFSLKCGDLFLVAERSRNVWGYIVTCTRGERAELVSIAIDPAVRRSGAASELLNATLRRLRRRGVRRLSLTVRVSNRKARALYEKYGFEKERLVRGYYHEGGDGVRMALAL
jgi:ribosomal-protein-alanine N-acetyltransferase